MKRFLALALFVSACEPDAAPRLTNRPMERGIRSGGSAAVPSAQGEAPSSARSDRWARLERESSSGEEGEGRPVLRETPGEGPPSQEAPERDLANELQRAFGTPTQCISQATRDRLEGTLRVQVQVNVSPTGVVTRASVSGGQLSEEDRECLTAHAERLRLQSPIPGAPRSITTSVEYTVASARAEAREETPRAEPIPGNVAPDRTLPAGGTEQNRPPGFVPPSQTLPAQVE